MNPRDPSVAIVETVARALGSLKQEFVFVGGCAVGLLITDEARPTVRVTQDVDLIVSVGSLMAYHQLAERLRELDFVEDAGAVVCRWRLGNVKVDVMPTEERILGFSNRWYPQAIRDARETSLPSGQVIRLIPAPHLVATKIEAFYSRGGGDFAASHDLEDIVNLFDGRAEIVAEARDLNDELGSYLRKELEDLLSHASFAVEYHLGPSAMEQARAEIVIERMRTVAGI